jgi:hypothetical protein
VPERQRELNEQRKQREPRAAFDIRTEPFHAETRLGSRRTSLPVPMLYYNIGRFRSCQRLLTGTGKR